MDAERTRVFLLALPHVVETMQWGNNLIFWAGDKAVGGKMFALVNLDGDDRPVISFAAGPTLYNELLEREGLVPAPYLARADWIAAERWDVFRPTEWQAHLRNAYSVVFNKLPARTRSVLALPGKEQKRIITERRKTLSNVVKT